MRTVGYIFLLYCYLINAVLSPRDPVEWPPRGIRCAPSSSRRETQEFGGACDDSYRRDSMSYPVLYTSAAAGHVRELCRDDDVFDIDTACRIGRSSLSGVVPKRVVLRVTPSIARTTTATTRRNLCSSTTPRLRTEALAVVRTRELSSPGGMSRDCYGALSPSKGGTPCNRCFHKIAVTTDEPNRHTEVRPDASPALHAVYVPRCPSDERSRGDVTIQAGRRVNRSRVLVNSRIVYVCIGTPPTRPIFNSTCFVG